MSKATPLKALLVNADGTVEELAAGAAVGLYHIRDQRCECGYAIKGKRYYKSEFASNRDTLRDGQLLEGAEGPGNNGCIVLVEKPSV